MLHVDAHSNISSGVGFSWRRLCATKLSTNGYLGFVKSLGWLGNSVIPGSPVDSAFSKIIWNFLTNPGWYPIPAIVYITWKIIQVYMNEYLISNIITIWVFKKGLKIPKTVIRSVHQMIESPH